MTQTFSLSPLGRQAGRTIDTFCGYTFHDVSRPIQALDITPIRTAPTANPIPRNQQLAWIGDGVLTGVLARQAREAEDIASIDLARLQHFITYIKSNVNLSQIPKATEISQRILISADYVSNNLLPSHVKPHIIMPGFCKAAMYMALSSETIGRTIKTLIGAVAQDSNNTELHIRRVVEELGIRFPRNARALMQLEQIPGA